MKQPAWPGAQGWWSEIPGSFQRFSNRGLAQPSEQSEMRSDAVGLVFSEECGDRFSPSTVRRDATAEELEWTRLAVVRLSKGDFSELGKWVVQVSVLTIYTSDEQLCI